MTNYEVWYYTISLTPSVSDLEAAVRNPRILMADRTSILRLTDIIEAIERIRIVISDATLDTFEGD